jgi:hypothetical protein
MTDTNRNPESKHTSMCTWKSPCEPEKEEEEAAGTALEKVEERTESAIATKKMQHQQQQTLKFSLKNVSLMRDCMSTSPHRSPLPHTPFPHKLQK